MNNCKRNAIKLLQNNFNHGTSFGKKHGRTAFDHKSFEQTADFPHLDHALPSCYNDGRKGRPIGSHPAANSHPSRGGSFGNVLHLISRYVCSPSDASKEEEHDL
jgi:hypothetical protein